MRRLTLAALGAALLTGCVDFTDPLSPWKPDLGAQAQLFMSVSQPAEASSPILLSLSASVFPGTDDSGHHFPLLIESFDAMGDALEPAPVGPDGWRRYNRSWPLAADSFEANPIRLAAPAIAGIDAAAPEVSWYTVARQGPGVVELAEGEPLVIGLRGLERQLTPAPFFDRWTLDLMGPRGSYNIGSNGLPSPRLRVPVDWLPGRAGETVSVRMMLTRMASHAPPPGDYPATVMMTTEIRWTVKITEP